MKQVKEKLVLILIIALSIGMFDTGLLTASAAVKSSWMFKTGTGIKLQLNDTIYMKKNEFQDFNLYKSGKEIRQDDSRYEVTWSSDNEDVIWINSKTGKSRADRFGTMEEDSGNAVITAKIKNKTTKAIAYRKFKVVVGATKPTPTAKPISTPTPTPTPTKAPEAPKPVSIALQFKDKTDVSQPLEPNYTYQLETLVYDKDKKLISPEIHKLYFKYFSNADGIRFTGADFKATKNGEYTITVGAYKTEAEAKSATSAKTALFTAELKDLQVKASHPMIIQIRQMTLDTVRLTLNAADYAQELVKDPSLLKVECNTNLYTYSVPINTITQDETDECSVLVEMRSRLTESYHYEYSYDGEEAAVATVIGSGATPASIRLIGGPVEAQAYYPFEVKVYSNRGVDISDVNYYAIQYKSLSYNAMDFSHQLSGNQIWFAAEGKSAVIEASLDLGYDEKGNKLPVLTSNAQFYSVPKAQPVYTRSQLFAFADEKTLLTPEKLNYQPSTQTICMGDYDYYAVAAFNYVSDRKQESTQYIVAGRDTTGSGYAYTYRSADPSVLLVGETTGNLVPIQTGSTVIYIVQHTEIPLDETKGKVVAVIPINVAPERALETFTLTEQSSINLSTTGNTNGDEFISIKLKALDQQGDPVAASYSFSVVEPVGASFGTLFNYSIENNVLKLWEGTGLNNLVDKDLPRSILVTITASYNNVQRQQNFQLQVRNTKDSDVYTSELYLTNPRVDMKLGVADLNHYISTVQVRSIDKNGYFIRLESIQIANSISEASKVNGVYSIIITESVDDTNASDLIVETAEKALKVKLVNVENDVITKADTGIYKITLYRGNGSAAVHVMTKGLEVVDSSLPLTVMQNKFSLPYADTTTVKDAITVLRGSSDITEFVTIHDMKSVRVDNILVVYEIYANIRTQEQNDEWNENYRTSVTITPATPLQFVIGQ